uniref:Uncharacterized protein n=1 Tax=Odontella aurita TaxID=265563 RepID=A0A7S4K143_9STRA|mmetsp:Transcript_59140/g.175797  ORF Transcript_59140/g.175797 Transcript_59140/m.175797 type:complete len:278 (+) Transcript_59140:134-967(+)
MCDPLTQLRVQGFLCPCAESEDDYVARVAALTLQGVPARWYREVRNDGSVKAAVLRQSASKGDAPSEGGSSNYFLGSVVTGFNRGVDQVTKALSLESLPPASYPTIYVAIEATLSILEGPKGPSILVTPTSISDAPENFYDFCDSDDAGLKSGTKRTPASKTVPLSDITEVAPGDGFFQQRGRVSCGVRVHGRPDSNGTFGALGLGKKVLQFDVGESAVHSVTRDEVVQHLKDLVDWDEKRRNPPPEEAKVASSMNGGVDFVSMGSGERSHNQVSRR